MRCEDRAEIVLTGRVAKRADGWHDEDVRGAMRWDRILMTPGRSSVGLDKSAEDRHEGEDEMR